MLSPTVKEENIVSESIDFAVIKDEVLTDNLCKQLQLRKTSLMIHTFTVAHGTTTFILDSGADTVLLAAETTAKLYLFFKQIILV